MHSREALQRLAVQLRSSLKSWRAKPLNSQPPAQNMENVWLLCWLLKDLGWVLLCGPIAWPAALAAVVLQARDVLQQVDTMPLAEWVHSLAILGWLCGSSMWMTAQLLFEPEIHASKASPWYSGSIFTANAEHYHLGVFGMEAFHFTTLFGLLMFYSMHLWGETGLSIWTSWSQNPTADAIRQRNAHQARLDVDEAGASSDEALIFGVMTPKVYSKTFIVPWILKDVFWCHQSFIPAILCVFLVTILQADCLWLFKKWTNLALLLWTTGSAVWLSNDLVMHEQENWPLLLSILFFAVGACIMSAAIVARPPYDEIRDFGCKEEHCALI